MTLCMLTYRFCPLSNPNSPEIRQVCFSVKQPAPADCFHLADCKVNEFFHANASSPADIFTLTGRYGMQ